MESGGSSNAMQTYPFGTGSNEGGPTPANNSADVSYKRPADQYMPISQVVRIMRHALPAHAKISDDAKETVQECVSEFINFVTTRANERCHGEYRKTISPDDVLSAMGSLGFNNYVEPLAVFLDNHRAQDPERSSRRYAPYARHGAHRPPVAQMAQPPRPILPPPQVDDGYFMSGGGQDGGEGFSGGGADLDPFAELFK